MSTQTTKTFVILIAATLIAAFFMPWLTILGRFSAYDLVFGNIGDMINSPLRFIVALIPLSGAIIIYSAAFNQEQYPLAKGFLFILPLITLVVTIVTILYKLSGGDLSGIKFDELVKVFEIGFWLTLICSVLLCILGLNDEPKPQAGIASNDSQNKFIITPETPASDAAQQSDSNLPDQKKVYIIQAVEATIPEKKTNQIQKHHLLLIASILIILGFFMPWVNLKEGLGSFIPTINGPYLISQTDRFDHFYFGFKLLLIFIPVGAAFIAFYSYQNKLEEKRLIPFIALCTPVPIVIFFVNFLSSNSNAIGLLRDFFGNFVSLGNGLIIIIAGSFYYLFYTLNEVVSKNKLLSSKSMMTFPIISGVISGLLYYLIIKRNIWFNDERPFFLFLLISLSFSVFITAYFHKRQLGGIINYSRVIVTGFFTAFFFLVTLFIAFCLFSTKEMRLISNVIPIFAFLALLIFYLYFIISSLLGIWLANFGQITLPSANTGDLTLDVRKSEKEKKSISPKETIIAFGLSTGRFFRKYRLVIIPALLVFIIGIILWIVFKPDPEKEGKKAVALQCNCADKQSVQMIQMYEGFLNSLSANHFTRRGIAKHSLDSLTHKIKVDDTVCIVEANEKIDTLRQKFAGNTENLSHFNDLILRAASYYHPVNQAKENNLLLLINQKIAAISDPEPDSNSMKLDMIGWSIPGRKFAFTSEFVQFKISDYTKAGDKIDYLADLILSDNSTAQIVITYLLEDNGWKLAGLKENFITIDQVVPSDSWVNVCPLQNQLWSAANTSRISWKIGEYGQEYQSGPDVGVVTLPFSDCYLMKSRENAPVTIRFTYKPKYN